MADVYSLYQIKVNTDEIHKWQRMIYLTQNLITRAEVDGENQSKLQ